MRRLQARNSRMDTDLTEVTRYLTSPIVILHQGDPLVWWKSNTIEFPTICHMARDILSIPTSSVSVERLFSSARDVIPYRQNCLGEPMIQDLLITKSWQKGREGDKASEREDCDELDHRIEVDLENIGGILQAHGLDTEFLHCMIPVQDGNSEDECHRNDESEEDMQSDHEGDIVPSMDGSPIGRYQEGLTLQGTFSDVLERLRSEPETPTPHHTKRGRQKTLSGNITPMAGRLRSKFGRIIMCNRIMKIVDTMYM